MLTLPASVTRISNVQTRSSYKLQSDSSVTPNPPSAFTMQLGADPWLPNAALISITGVAGKYTGGMASIGIPLPENTGNVRMTTRFALSGAFLASGQALELGGKIAGPEGEQYNPNINLDNSPAGSMTLDVVNASQGWSSAATGLPKFVPNVKNTVIVDYQFNITTKIRTMVGVSVNGTEYDIPADLQQLPALPLGWAPNQLVPCFQPNVNQTGGSYEWMVYRCDLEVW